MFVCFCGLWDFYHTKTTFPCSNTGDQKSEFFCWSCGVHTLSCYINILISAKISTTTSCYKCANLGQVQILVLKDKSSLTLITLALSDPVSGQNTSFQIKYEIFLQKPFVAVRNLTWGTKQIHVKDLKQMTVSNCSSYQQQSHGEEIKLH